MAPGGRIIGKDDNGKDIVEFQLKGGTRVSGVIVGENIPFTTLLWSDITGGNVKVNWPDIVETFTEPAPIPPKRTEGRQAVVVTEVVEPAVTAVTEE